jgi:hypothetical protein
VKPAVPPKNKFLTAKKNGDARDFGSHHPHHRPVSPQSSSGTVSSSADVDSNAPIEEMYALARKYEKLAGMDPDFLKRCEADSEGLRSEAGDDQDDDGRPGWASPRSAGAGSGGVGLVVGDEASRVDPVS